MAYIKVRVLDAHWLVKVTDLKQGDIMRNNDGLATFLVFAGVFLVAFLVFSSCGTGSQYYQVPGVSVDVDHPKSKATPKGGYSKPKTWGGSSSRKR